MFCGCFFVIQEIDREYKLIVANVVDIYGIDNKTNFVYTYYILSIWCFKRFQHCRTKVHRFNFSECVISLTSFFKLISKIRLEHISDHISYDTFKKKTRNFNQTVIRMWRYYKKRAIYVIIAVLAEISTEQFDECLWPVKTLNELMECSNGAIWVPMESLCIWFPFNKHDSSWE